MFESANKQIIKDYANIRTGKRTTFTVSAIINGVRPHVALLRGVSDLSPLRLAPHPDIETTRRFAERNL